MSAAPPGGVIHQIAATAIHHELELVTGNLRHFRIPGLRVSTTLEEARRGQPSR
jgi:predicted nucleic acid-binding protein